MEYRQLVLIAICFSFSLSDETPSASTKPLIIPLNGDSWIVKGIKNSTKTIKGTVPGGIYTDLRNAGLLEEDIFYDDNDIKYRWVAKDDWSYSTSFKVTSDVLSRENVWLVFHGLDTIAKITLNDHTLATANNMFVRFKFDVKKLLKDGDNDLQVSFKSPISAASDLSAASKYRIPPSCTPREYNGECHVNFLRKMQASFAWDWGPAFPSVGIWKPVNIEAFDNVIIRSISIATDKLMDTWEVKTKIYLETAPNKTFKIHPDLKIFSIMSNGKISQLKLNLDFPVDGIEIKSNEDSEADFSIDEIFVNENVVSSWWPNGYGTQKLYNLQVTLKAEGGKEVTEKTVQFGFRTVKLVQDEIDCHKSSHGRSFYFEVNGVKIFGKGTNYIPAHILPELGTDLERVRMILYSAKEAHMNMIRVWGGGVYETDEFYKLCDEMGIMVWQDMMFACNMYPANDEFLKSVSKEIVQNVRRLQRHPSIVLWAGNNENEAALAQNWYDTSSYYQQYKDDYQMLYVKTIKRLVEENDKSRSFITSSPTNGVKSQTEGYVSLTPQNRFYGDVHEYTYYDNNWLASSVQPARFISEYGIQAMPSFSTFLNATKPENATSISAPFFQSRQHHAGGYQQMTSEISMNMNNPENKDVQTYIYYSQINQAMSIRTKTEAFRRFRDSIGEDGEGMTMGALFWQLNDVWQAPSWSSIEFGGKWKMLHNFAKLFFAQILVSPWKTEKGNLAVKIVSDKRSGPPITKLILKTQIYHWNSTNPVATISSQPLRLDPLSTITLPETPLEKLLDHPECGPKDEASRNCFLMFDLKQNKTGSVNVAPQTFLLPENLKRINGPKKSTIQVVKIKRIKVDNISPLLPKQVEKYDITLVTDAIALFVWLDVGKLEGHFYDNGFIFLPKEKTISFMSYKPINECLLSEAITIQTINGSFSVDENVKKTCMINDEEKKPASEEKPKEGEKETVKPEDNKNKTKDGKDEKAPTTNEASDKDKDKPVKEDTNKTPPASTSSSSSSNLTDDVVASSSSSSTGPATSSVQPTPKNETQPAAPVTGSADKLNSNNSYKFLFIVFAINVIYIVLQ